MRARADDSATSGLVLIAGALLALVACGSRATLEPCDNVRCSDRGQCIDHAGQPYCSCEPGYVPDGLACLLQDLIHPCEGVECTEHGHCEVMEGSPACTCDAGYATDPSELLCLSRVDVGPADSGPDEIECGIEELLVDDFDDGVDDLERVEVGPAASSMTGWEEDGIYHFEGGGSGSGALVYALAGEESWGDVRVEADVTLVDTQFTVGNIGLVAGYTADGGSYELYVAYGTGFRLNHRRSDGGESLGTRNRIVELGVTYHLAIELVGREITVFVDGEDLFGVITVDFSIAGRAGLLGDNGISQYDNLRVTSCE